MPPGETGRPDQPSPPPDGGPAPRGPAFLPPPPAGPPPAPQQHPAPSGPPAAQLPPPAAQQPPPRPQRPVARPPRPHRSPPRWIPLLVLLLCTGLMATAMAWADRPDPIGAPPADAGPWVPDEGSSATVRTDSSADSAGASVATVENAFGTRAEAGQSLSLKIGGVLLGSGSAGVQDQVWRQTVSAVDPDVPQAVSVFGFDDGVRLDLDLIPGRDAVGFRPGLPMLPRGVAAGDWWREDGDRLTADGDRRRYSARMSASAGPDDCLTVHVWLTVGDEPERQTAWGYCPSAGLVARDGDGFGFTRAPGAAEPDTARPDLPPDPAAAAGAPTKAVWEVPTADGPDRLMGTPRTQVTPFALGPDRLVWANHAMRDLILLDVAGTPGAPTLELHRRLHPGGLVLAAGQADGTVLASTSRRTLTAWNASGTRLWSVRTDDVVHRPAIRLDDRTIAVIEASGTISAYDRGTGRLRWQVTDPEPITIPAVTGDGLLVSADSDGVLRALDVTNGSLVWTVAGDAADRIGLLGDRVVVVSGGLAHGYRSADGRELWTERVAGVVRTIGAGAEETVVVAGTRDLVALTADGRVRWRAAQTCDALVPAAEGAICADGATARILDPATGAVRRQLPVPKARGDLTWLQLGGRLWLMDTATWTAWAWGEL